MTSDEIVYQHRVRVLGHARVTRNVAATCRTFGMSRKTFYKWRNIASMVSVTVPIWLSLISAALPTPWSIARRITSGW